MQKITMKETHPRIGIATLLVLLVVGLFQPAVLSAQCTTGTDTGYPDFTPNYSGNAEWISGGSTSNGKYYTINVEANRFYTFYAYTSGSAEDGYQDYLTVTDDQGFYLAAGYSPLLLRNLSYSGPVRLYYHTNEACQTNSVNKRLYAMSYTADRWPPTNLTTSNITTSSVTLNWQWNWIGPVPSNGFQYYIAEAPGTFGLPLPPDNNATSAVTGFSLTNSATVNNLNVNQRYHYWVRSNYGTHYSVWMQGGEFVTTPVSCNLPTALTVQNITANSASFSWQAPNPVPSQGYQFGINQSGLEPNASQTTYPQNTSEFIANLSPNTTYYYFVRSDCNTQQSAWVLGGTFTTPAALNCNSAVYGLNPANTFSPLCTGSAETIVSNAKAGEFSHVAVAANKQYTFASSVATDYLTITNNAGTVIYAHGVSPVSWQSGAAGETIRFFLHSNASCGTSTTGRTKTVSCTSVTSCAPPTNLSSSNVLSTQANISWTASASNPAQYDVYFDTANVTPNAGTVPVGSIAGTSAVLNNLTAATTYYFWVRSNCNPQVSSWVFGGSFTTTAALGCTTAAYGLYPANTYTPSCTGANELIVANAWAGEYANIAVVANRTYTFSSSVATDFVTITNAAGTTVLSYGTSPLVWNSAANAGTVRYYLHSSANCDNQDTNRSRFIQCQAAGVCTPPTELNVVGLTANSAAFSWTASSPAPANGYQYYLSTSATAPNPGTTPTGSVSNTTLNVFGLSSNTLYYFWLRAQCGATSSAWVSGGSFTTQGVSTFCTTAVYGQYPSGTFTPNCSGSNEVIVSNARAGEYTAVNLVANKQYTFTSSVTTDYITITNANGTALLVSGIAPLSWNSGTNSGVIRYYLHADSGCSFENANRVRSVRCTNALDVIENTSSLYTVFQNSTGSLVSISAMEVLTRVEVINTLGQTIMELTPQSKEVQVDLSSFSSGLYSLRIYSAQGQQTHKAIRL